MMKVILFAVCFGFCLFSHFAHSALMVLQPDRSSYQVGDSIQLELKLTDLNVTDVGSTVAAFWTQLFYQPAALRLKSWQFGSGLADATGSLQFAEHDVLNGILTLDEYAFAPADPATLAASQQLAIQQGDLLLARFTWQALQAGDWQLAFDPKWFGVQSFAGDRISITGADLRLTITAAQVPAPATLMLLLGGLGLLRQRRRTFDVSICA